MATTNGRPRPQKYPDELRERAVRMVLEIRRQTGERQGSVARVARELGIGDQSLRNWVNQAEIDGGRRPGTSTADAQAHRRAGARGARAAPGQRHPQSRLGFFATELDGRPKR